MTRIYNFSAGPSMLPEAVLRRAGEEILEWGESGMSVMEMSHRGKHFGAIAEKTEADLRELLAIPPEYKVLFLQGGATAQFAMVPMNLLRDRTSACYVDTGIWSGKAIEEASRYCQVMVAATARAGGFTTVPARDEWRIDPEAAYLHYTANETINGVEFQDVPDSGGLPLVCDMSSNILSRPVDVERFGLIYAGAQKNMGPAGITVVIVREDLIGKTIPGTPTVFDYRKHADNGSMLNTPPTYIWYLVGLVLEWLKREGGVAAMNARNIRKAEKLYAAIDASSFYSNPIDPAFRSRMNVPFRLADASLEKTFAAEAAAQGLEALEGHRSVGGLRASIYNAMPEAGVDALIAFMADFERRYG
ncbi:3-phosphoserine/phosphohydroxythreonine transaminase [Methylococcus capsulatus]|jgi:phosphoserine aminotransferase|uniref:Phosphoserine aminotransferase n=1 Tax=Methylococcus capsulatus TaxID=414 RepID=A0AA35UKG2_METCP|nr:3-phosphoserine/phosphohydroxythreonine transaminase [Methylococcus capsulatus]CAI8887945.1 phosphoserine/phosphohydroxythreonine aminotransferase [Methylococcus capsulatus]